VRSALDAIGLPADLLLQHGSPRLVYVVPLATNFRDVLIGRSRRPQYTLPDDVLTEKRIGDYWSDRWLSGRIERENVIADVAAHTLVYPIRHGARVSLPEVPNEAGPLFEVRSEVGLGRVRFEAPNGDLPSVEPAEADEG